MGNNDMYYITTLVAVLLLSCEAIMSSLPSIPILQSQKSSKSISFELREARRKRRESSEPDKPRKLSENVSNIENHGNTTVQDKTTKSFREMIGDLDKKEAQELSRTQKGFVGGSQMNSKQKDNAVVYSHNVQGFYETFPSNPHNDVKVRRSEDVDTQLSKMLREKDREISRLREIIRKASLDRENATCADTNSRMRVAVLKNKLSNQQRHIEHVTTVEKLRCKEKISNETERLRHERDDARVQVAHYEKLVWQLRKQVEQLGYLSRQR